MNDLIWINGEILHISDARIGVEDRGFQFADGVYEVVRFYNGKSFTMREHLERLTRSADGIKLALPMPIEQLQDEIVQFVPRTGMREGYLYLQLTRGVVERNHRFPKHASHTLLFYMHELPPPLEPGEGEGLKLLPLPDERWKRCWIKSIGLIANVLAKNEAIAHGFDEAVFVDREAVTEGATCNIFAALGGKLVTHPVGAKVLSGITRMVVFDIAAKLGVPIDERPLREEEAVRADEMVITSTTREIAWVARWNDRYIGQGKCGPITMKLHRAYRERVRTATRSHARVAPIVGAA